MIGEYWHVWLPYALAAVALAVLATLSALRVGRTWRIASAWTFGLYGAALAVAGGTAAALADAAGEGDGLTVFDRPVWQWFVEHRSPTATTIFKAITTLGSTVSMTVLAVVVVLVLGWRRSWGAAIFVAVVSAGAGLIVFFGKRAVGRVRPPEAQRLVTETNASFPSGHALAATAVIGACVLMAVVAMRDRAPRWRAPLIVLAAVFVASIGISRLYLGVHWATDVLGGWVTGAAWLLLCVTVRRLWRAWQQPTAQRRLAANPPPDTRTHGH
ncbi:phosphatase PAP2 family protein [Nakamurella aerolata]|uniref:Phosphatase PAP2 family protein n=1 Tax=Nakamurella aerolata TaxID=1656892 RepID=A0A849A9R9_9ACTN|nr:phosphatase PAP2 family protein [Nakamurella aerolata]NNG35230.1 phosphatase PAP2 family protein [Nakamurella aerolata]